MTGGKSVYDDVTSEVDSGERTVIEVEPDCVFGKHFGMDRHLAQSEPRKDDGARHDCDEPEGEDAIGGGKEEDYSDGGYARGMGQQGMKPFTPMFKWISYPHSMCPRNLSRRLW